MTEDRLRHQFGDYLGKAEVAIYSILAVLLALTALVTIASAAKILWETASVAGRLLPIRFACSTSLSSS
jgi:hypothetical protein